MLGGAMQGKARVLFSQRSLQMKMVKASELVEDFDLYPRGDVDSSHVASLAEALLAGEEVPPILADKKTKRIADGFHRRRAFIKNGGPDALVPVVFKDYASDADLFLDAMEHNSGHGRRLTSVDAVRSATKAKAFGLDDIVIAKALKMTIERVGALVIDRTAKCGAVTVPLKQTIRHMAGKKLSKPQQEANRKLSGMNQVFYVNQIVTLIENDLLDKENEDLMLRLQVLQGLLEGMLVTSSA